MKDFGMGVMSGIISSLIVTWVIWFLSHKKNRRKLRRFEKLWLEVIEGQPERMYSLAEFEYSKKHSNYFYNGNNYQNNGTLYYKWRTIILEYEEPPGINRIYYIYAIEKNGGGTKKGFGWIDFSKKAEAKFDIGSFFEEGMNENERPEIKEIKLYDAKKIAERLNIDRLDKDNQSTCILFFEQLEKKRWVLE